MRIIAPPTDPSRSPSPAELRVRDRLVSDLEQAVRDPASIPPPAPVGPSVRSEPDLGRPITLNAAMVRALMAGHKTQTRRPIRPLPAGQLEVNGSLWPADASGEAATCRLARVEEVLWVREPWAAGRNGRFVYEADLGPAAPRQRKWRAGRFLARHASRLRLRVTHIVPERLGAINSHDAASEGMPPGLFSDEDTDAPVIWFHRLWDSIYGRTEFAADQNPWVWAIHFRVFTPESHR